MNSSVVCRQFSLDLLETLHMHSLVAYLSRYGKVNVIKVVHSSRGFFKNDEKSPFLLATQGVVVTKINFVENGKNLKVRIQRIVVLLL